LLNAIFEGTVMEPIGQASEVDIGARFSTPSMRST